MIEKKNGKQSVRMMINSKFKHEENLFLFSSNGHQSTGVNISLEQYDMLLELLNEPDVVNYYENIRKQQS